MMGAARRRRGCLAAFHALLAMLVCCQRPALAEGFTAGRGAGRLGGAPSAVSVAVKITVKGDGGEVSWKLGGDACAGGPYEGDDRVYTKVCALTPGISFVFEAFDSGNDGWGAGASYEVLHLDGESLLGPSEVPSSGRWDEVLEAPMVYPRQRRRQLERGNNKKPTHAFQFVDMSEEQLAVTTPGYRFGGATVANNGKVVFVPCDSTAVGVYDPSDKSFVLHDISDTVDVIEKFYGAALASNGNIIFPPYNVHGSPAFLSHI